MAGVGIGGPEVVTRKEVAFCRAILDAIDRSASRGHKINTQLKKSKRIIAPTKIGNFRIIFIGNWSAVAGSDTSIIV